MKKRLGFIVPSSNTVLEPVTSKLCEEIAELSVHYSRIRVTGISLSESALGQFEHQKFVAASDLLADAEIDLVVWNGTSGSWLGPDYDRSVCKAITAAIDRPALTTTLAYHEMLARAGVQRIGLVTPYTRDVQERIADVWGDAGFDCVDERHLGIERNFSFGDVPEAEVEKMVMAVARSGCEAIVILCTNFLGTWIAPRAEAVLGIPVLDSVSVTLRASLDHLGLDSAPLAPWGRVFADQPAAASREALADALQLAPA